MTKAKISEYDAVAANNTDVNGVNIAENCPPSGMNNMGREIMAALKRFETGADGDSLTVGGNLVVSGTSTLSTTSISSADINGGTIDDTAIGGSTAAAGSFTTLNTSGQVVFNDAGADVDFRVESDTDANALFVEGSSGNVGIGASTGLISGLSLARGSGVTALIETAGNGNTLGTTSVLYGQDSANNGYAWNRASSPMLFGTANNERARITSDGFFKAKGNETNYINTAGLHHEFINGAGDNVVTINRNTAASPYGTFTNFTGGTPNNTTNYFESYEDTTNLKAILYSNGSWQVRANSYGGISDVKLKQDIVDANSQWDDIKGLRIRKYRFKDEVAADPNYPSHLGVIAQEAEIVSPGLVFESPDFENVEVPVLDDEGNPVIDEDGNPQVTTERQATGTVTKGVKYSILYMKAVKALQEAMERIETLEAKVATLEAK